MHDAERDERILAHIGRYRVTLRPVLDRLFFGADSSGCGNVLARMLQAGSIRSRVLTGRLCYYQLTEKGAAGRVPEGRSREIRGQALRGDLSILWFCCMQDVRRQRLEQAETAKLFPELRRVPHVVEPGEPKVLFRIRVVGPRTKPGQIVREIRRHVFAAREAEDGSLAAWIEKRYYAFAVLAERPERVQAIRRAAQRAGLDKTVRIDVVEVPDRHRVGRASSDDDRIPQRPE